MPKKRHLPIPSRADLRAHLPLARPNEFSDEHETQASLLHSFLEIHPAKRKVVKHPFTDEVKAALLAAMKERHWTTAREAYGWAWNELGVRVSYLTIWRFFTARGLFNGETPRGRRLASRAEGEQKQ